MQPVNWICLAAGLVVLAWAFWERLGRGRNARAWVGSPRRGTPARTLVARPGLGLFLLVVGTAPWLGGLGFLGGVVGLTGFIGLLCFLVFGGFQVREPAFVRPRWYRQLLAERAATRRKATP